MTAFKIRHDYSPIVAENVHKNVAPEKSKNNVIPLDLSTLSNEEKIERCLKSRAWRLDNLYKIINKDGELVQFKMNAAQRKLLKNVSKRNLVLKARQQGFTTFILLLFSDTCLFNSNVSCGVIAHGTREASELFRNKVLFALENLPDWLKHYSAIKSKSQTGVKFANGSSIQVGTSFRSGTPQWLLISEFGKICKKYPIRAEEIITGTLPALPINGVGFIESTAEGREGYFAEMTLKAEQRALNNIPLTRKDFKFQFSPWYETPEYQLNTEECKAVEINDRFKAYFIKLEKENEIVLTEAQQKWYIKEEETLGPNIKREFPTIAKEAFEVFVEGAYFKVAMERAYVDGRIGIVPFNAAYNVDTWWDVGLDTTAIWFTQTVGSMIHVIDYYHNNELYLDHYSQVIKDKTRDLGYRYNQHFGPHDIKHRNWSANGSKMQIAKTNYNLKFTATKVIEKEAQITLGHMIIGFCRFDENKCHDGIIALENYKKEWNTKTQTWKETPLHNWASHGADAFMQMACNHPIMNPHRNKALGINPPSQKSRQMTTPKRA
ncbi:MAG: terminase [Pseudomonadota bacterium]